MNLTTLLLDRGVRVAPAGHKHHKPGWTHVCCPDCADSNFHLGFPDGSFGGNCFRCGKKQLADTLHKLLGGTWGEARAAARSIAAGASAPRITRDEMKPVVLAKAPLGANVTPGKAHLAWLEQRGLDVASLTRYWRIRFIHKVGEQPWSIAVPVISEQDEILCWRFRDVSNLAENRWMGQRDGQEKQVLYGAHLLSPTRRTVLVVEGQGDAWRFSPGFAVATSGQGWTRDQLLQLAGRFDNVFVLYDDETIANSQAARLCDALLALGLTSASRFSWKWIHSIRDPSLPYATDPGELTEAEAKIIEDVCMAP